MSEQLDIEFIADVACPWCAIGLASLEEALRRTAGDISALIRLQPFELNPDMPAGGANVDEYLGARYGADPAHMATTRQHLRARAAIVGFSFKQDASSRIYNTFDAHRLLHWAGQQGRQLELQRVLFTRNFTEGADVSDPEVLVSAAVAAGLDGARARDVLGSGRYAEDVRQAERHAHARGINAVPATIINGQWLISGGQSPEHLEAALRNIAASGRSHRAPEA